MRFLLVPGFPGFHPRHIYDPLHILAACLRVLRYGFPVALFLHGFHRLVVMDALLHLQPPLGRVVIRYRVALPVVHVHGFFLPYAVLRQMYTAK